MQLKIVKLRRLSGPKMSVYSLLDLEVGSTLFENFLSENKQFVYEIKDILKRINIMARKTGAEDNFFKLHEGNPGDSVVALYDRPDRHLRLYCIRLRESIIILGGGGPKNVRALQEDPKLNYENKILRLVAKELDRRIKDREITFTEDYMEIEGDLTFEI